MPDQFTAYFAHSLPAGQLFRLPELLARSWPPGDDSDSWAGSTRWGELDGALPWAIDGDAGNTIPFRGPSQIAGLVGRHILALTHPAPWTEFCRATLIRNQLRSVCRSIARTIGSKRWVYLSSALDPIELVIRGDDFEALSRWLARRPQPPPELVKL